MGYEKISPLEKNNLTTKKRKHHDNIKFSIS